MLESLYLAAESAGFLRECIWLPGNGQPVERHSVGFTAPEIGILDNLGMSTDYAITYPASWFVGLAKYDSVTVAGIAYQVREPRAIGDGSEYRTTLTRL